MAYRYKCDTCDEWHEGFPDLGYACPAFAEAIPEAERAERLVLTSDLCVIDDEHFFIRCLLPLPVQGISERFGWGVWSSLSEANFRRYEAHFDDDLSGWPPMFGYLCNALPGYPDTLGLHLSVQTQTAGLRPIATLEPTDHTLAVEQREGIPLDKVLRLVDPYLHQ